MQDLSQDILSRLTPELLVQAVRKHWPLLATVALTVFLGSAFYTFGQTKIYRSTATIHVDPNPPRPLGNDVQTFVDMGVGSYWSNKEYYATQNKIIQSRAVLDDTVAKLGLHRDPRFMENTARGRPDPAVRAPAPEIPDASAVLKSRLKVEPVKDSRLVTISYDDADPERGKRILSALVEVYLDRNVERVVASTDSAGAWLRDQVGNLKTELESSELALHDYKKAKQILSVSLDDQSNMLRQEMQQLNQALTQVRAHREALLARWRELSKIDAKDPDNVPASELLNNTLLTTLRGRYVEVKAHRDGLLGGGKGPRHPDAVSAEAVVTTAREALLGEIGNVKGAVKSDLDAATREVAGLSALADAAKSKAMELNMLEIEYRRLERSKDNTERLYGLVLERSKESELSSLMRFNNISVVEPAISQKTPVEPRVGFNLLVGLGIGLALGLGLAAGHELLDSRIRSPDDLEAAVGAPFFGILPAASGRGGVYGAYAPYGRTKRPAEPPPNLPPELAAHAMPGQLIAEAARTVRTNLMFSSLDEPYRRLLVTSASPGEGKTMVATTLAIVLAQAGKKVMLLDCDLRRARLHRVFHLANDVGISSILLDRTQLDLERAKTVVPNLSVLPAGPRVATPAELLQSTAFQSLLADLSAHYDTVVLDSPPVTPVTDAAILTSQVSATVFVARANKSSRQLARRAARTLRDVGGKIAGCVLNDVSVQRSGYGYYRYHAYGYGPTEVTERPPGSPGA